MPKNRIGMILEHGFPPDIRVEKEARALKQAGFDVSILCRGSSNIIEVADWEGVEIVRFPIARPGSVASKVCSLYELITLISPQWKKAVRHFIVEKRPNILHVHDLRLVKTVLLESTRRGVPVVADLHENYPAAVCEWRIGRPVTARFLEGAFQPYTRLITMEKRVLGDVVHTIAVVEEMKERLVRQHGMDPNGITVVTNTEERFFGQDVEWDEKIISEYKQYFTLLYIGGFGPHRGLDSVVKGVHLLREKIPNIKLLLVGKGSAIVEDNLDNLIKELDLEETVKMLGWQPFAKVSSFMKAASVGLVPHNSNEHTDSTIPHKLFQYMTVGTPVLVSSCPPLKRVVTEVKAGVWFEASNPWSFAEKVAYLADNPQKLEEYAQNGKKATLQGSYNWEQTSKKLIDFYSRILGGAANKKSY